MPRLTELRLPLDHPDEALPAAIRARLGLSEDVPLSWTVARRGYDARNKQDIRLVYSIDVTEPADVAVTGPHIGPIRDVAWRPVAHAPSRPGLRPVVIGAGPCGLFAALVLAEMGLRPLILERGRLVRERTRDTWGLWRRGVLVPESNAQFGEGGAGTFSDGKLYSGIKEARDLGRKVLTEFVAAGGPEEILRSNKPHIGTFRLVTIVEGLREKIEALGGEYRFGAKVTGIDIAVGTDDTRQVRALELESGEIIATNHVVLAIGHSARDTFHMLNERGVFMEPKPFSIGVRIEHPQSIIDHARFGRFAGHKLLGAADYKLVHHANNGRSVYSFCMCPGGRVVAAASEPGGVVTNGMSQYSRAEFNANAGIVVDITPVDYPGGPLAGIEYQRHWETLAFKAGGADYSAPCQRVGDLLEGRASTGLGSVVPSYQPGIRMTDLRACLPQFVITAIREALPLFDRRIPGFAMADAVLTGVETRTSSPLRITRGRSFVSINTIGLYPAGEGAGYAGGILSAGIDGIKVAEAVGLSLSG
ncbi:MAG: FAD-dependent protein [Acetobacteraceae bacterium]|jgi:uncharacterized FAD-dependent dehydrogenase